MFSCWANGKWSLLVCLLSHVYCCKISQFTCSNGICVDLDQYCDGGNDCGDKSDEPRYCTPCNRTYYGELGVTYEIDILRPRREILPFFCSLNFVARGHEFGDLIELSFESFTVGKFISFLHNGCHDGYMQIFEANRPASDGYWCGHGWGHNIYYSETTNVAVRIYLFNLTEEGMGYGFDFQLRYKFISQHSATVRYGPPSRPIYRGDLLKNSICNRFFDNCDKHECKVQSPNYPGMYPRNVTCFYTLRQTRAPDDTHSVITLQQSNGQKLHLKDGTMPEVPDRERRLGFWRDCDSVADYINIYDGPTVYAPLLVRFCKGDVLPAVVSSGSELLVEFHSSPFDKPFHPIPLRYLPGFEIDVKVEHFKKRGVDFVRNHKCEFLVTSFDQTSGVISNPNHSLPPNSTCVYFFQGKVHEVLWVYFLKYQVVYYHESQNKEPDCRNDMVIIDGRVSHYSANHSIGTLGTFCGDQRPLLCDHAIQGENYIPKRPCSREESYISSGPDLTIEQRMVDGAARGAVHFTLRYEFVNIKQNGEPPFPNALCDRIFRSRGHPDNSGKVSSPHNVFLFGRGGNKDLSCLYQFEGLPNEQVRITISKLRLRGRECHSYINDVSESISCASKTNKSANVWIIEHPWSDVVIPRYCLCDNSLLPKIYESTSNLLHVNFTVVGMSALDDFKDFFFQGTYEFVRRPLCLQERRFNSSHGKITFGGSGEGSQDVNCNRKPWMIEPNEGKFLYFSISGIQMNLEQPESRCITKNRIIIYSPGDEFPLGVICPSSDPHEVTHLFSKGWLNGDIDSGKSTSRSLVIDFIVKEKGEYTGQWLEVKKPLFTPTYSFSAGNSDCPYMCPEIRGCISAQLWCDGTPHCPSGFDEILSNCDRLQVPWLYIGVGTTVAALVFLVLAGTVVHRVKLRRQNGRGAKRVPTEEFIIDRKDSVC